jgi:orotidine-5'-phosphate decarboxylase
VQEAASSAEKVPAVIAVTVLTSIDERTLHEELGVPGGVENQVLRLAKLTESVGLDGIVCSAADLHAMKDQLRSGFLFVTPGIKGTTTPAGADQKRVLSPGRAVAAGSSLLVVGRAITGAPDRRKAALEVLQDIAGVL